MKTRQRGVGLVEMMIAMVIGLVMMSALSYFLLASMRTGSATADLSRMQESARISLGVIGRAVRDAGYRANLTGGFAGQPVGGLDGGSTDPDRLTLSAEPQPGGQRDCVGNSITSGLVVQTFTVNSNRQLVCSVGSTTAVVAENVENMQVFYRIDSGRDGVIDQMGLNASQVSDFSQVAAVRVELTLRGQSPSSGAGGDGYLRRNYSSVFTLRNQAG